MKTRVTIGFALLLVSSLLKSQESSFEKFERYFTWNPDSTSIYAKPDLQSEELIKLPYGTEVERLDEFRDKEAIVFIGELDGTLDRPERLGGYSLKTFWIKVECKGVTGYALNAEIINFPPFRFTEYGYFELDLEVLKTSYGVEHKRIKTTRVQKMMDGSGSYEVKVDSLLFRDGSYQVVEYYDGCFDRFYHYEGKTMDQVYFIFKTEYYSSIPIRGRANSTLFPKLIETEPTKFLFDQVDGYEGIYIDFSKKELVFGSYDCT